MAKEDVEDEERGAWEDVAFNLLMPVVKRWACFLDPFSRNLDFHYGHSSP